MMAHYCIIPESASGNWWIFRVASDFLKAGSVGLQCPLLMFRIGIVWCQICRHKAATGKEPAATHQISAIRLEADILELVSAID